MLDFLNRLAQKSRIYLDYAALTPPDIRVSREIAQTVQRHFANPSAIHADGVHARRALSEARARVARTLNAHADEILFVATGTEANNLAIFGLFKKLVMPKTLGGYGLKPSDLHCLVSEIEHTSVLESMRHLSEVGVTVEHLSIDATGSVDVAELRKKLRPNTFLVSVMSVNNEIGTVQPIDEVAKAVRKARKENVLAGMIARDTNALSQVLFPLFHCDASQSPLYAKLSTTQLGADLITLDSHKVCGPRSVGVLWVRRGIELMPIMYGGGQERGVRSGTENVPGAVGMAKALELAEGLREREVARLTELRNYFILHAQEKLAKKTPHVQLFLNGSSDIDSQHQSPHIVSVSFQPTDVGAPPIDHEFLLLKLDARGVACSTKSACLRDEDESYVIRALRRAQAAAIAAGILSAASVPRTPHALRFSFGRWTTKRDIDRAIIALVESLRSI
ncbi:MAG: cysteine desulfurase family protein [Patescibacteria group bacterium]